MQLHGFIRIVNFRLRSNTRVGITVTAQHRFDVVFHFGHFAAVIQLTRFNLGQLGDFRRMTGQIAVNHHAGELVLLAFSDIDGDVDAFFVRRQADLSRIDIKARVAAVQIETAQGFEVTRQLLLLVFAIANHVPPRHFITQLEA
ncbi:hypothetical protein D3C78_1293310 [compost metagenome]